MKLNIFLNSTAEFINHLIIFWRINLINITFLISINVLRLIIYILWLIIFSILLFKKLILLILCCQNIIWLFTLSITSKCILKNNIWTFTISYSTMTVIYILIIQIYFYAFLSFVWNLICSILFRWLNALLF